MNVYLVSLLLSIFVIAIPVNQQPPVQLTFEPATEKDVAAVKEYEAIWDSEGARIVQALEKRSELKFEESEIRVIVIEAMSSSGFRSIPMRLRSSYPPDTKKATLIHELGHRLHGRFFKKNEEDHPYLFLYLYDVWIELYGKSFADQAVKIESARRGYFDYENAWKDALSMTPSERQQKWQEFLKTRHI